MKKIALLILIAFPIFNYGQSKQTLDFKIGYTPQTIYNQSIQQTSENELRYEGSKEFLEQLKSGGVENPTITKSAAVIESVCKTGKAIADGSFPLTIEFLSTKNSENKTIIPNGTIMYGKSSALGMPKLDSIVAKGLDEAVKNSLLQTVQSTFSQLELPEKKMKVGESFSQETPFKIPVAGMSLEMVITTTYKLLSIADKTANFDIVVVYTMKVLDQKYNINATGAGKGNMVYDTPNHFPSQYNLDVEINFDLKQDDFSLKVKTKSGFNQSVKITKN